MNKVGFFRSIQLKFIIIYILLLLLAVQVIGSFFTIRLEDDLFESFKTSINERVELLSYNLEQAFERERNEEDGDISLQQEVQQIVEDISTDNAATTVQVIDTQRVVLGTNRINEMDEIGKKSTQNLVQQALFFDSQRKSEFNDNGESVYVQVEPIFDSEG